MNEPKLVNFSTLSDENLDAFVGMKVFLSHEYIHSLMNKAVIMGFSIEAIKETFKYFLSENKTTIDVFRADYAAIINDDKFLEKLIAIANEIDNNGAVNSHSIKAALGNAQLSEFDNEDDYTEDEDQFSGIYPEFTSQFDPIKSSSVYNNSFKPQMNFYQSVGIKAATPTPTSAGSVLRPMSQQQIMQQQQQESTNLKNDKTNLRPIIIDANDVAMSSHPNSQTFMISRVKKVVDFFEKRGHPIYVILSNMRKEQIMAGE